MLGRKKKAAPRDLTGWEIDIVNYPGGSKHYQVDITKPNGEPIIVINYGFPSTTLHVKGKSKEVVMEKVKQKLYDMLEEEELSQKNSVNTKF
jgi:hypothetical protein